MAVSRRGLFGFAIGASVAAPAAVAAVMDSPPADISAVAIRARHRARHLYAMPSANWTAEELAILSKRRVAPIIYNRLIADSALKTPHEA